jgi:hypothetical protein
MVYRQVRSFTESNQPRQHFLNIQARDSEKRIRQAHGFGGALDSSGEAAEGVLESTGVRIWSEYQLLFIVWFQETIRISHRGAKSIGWVQERM